MNRQICYLLTFCLATGLLTCTVKGPSDSGNGTAKMVAPASRIKVEGQLIESGDFPVELITNGKLEAFQKASLRFRGSEKVAVINYQNGSWVDSGRLVAELDNQMERLELGQAGLRMERVRIDRLALIAGYRIGARDPWDIPIEALKRFNMQTGYSEAELSYQQALIRFDYTRLIAPVSGRIASLTCKEQNFPADGKPFCEIINDRTFDVVLPLMENEIGEVHIGQVVTVKPFALDSVILMGCITEINPLVDEHGNVTIKARVPNTGMQLIEGMNVKAIIKDKVPGGLIVPKESVVLRNNRQVVFSLLKGRSYWNYIESDLENSTSYRIRVENAGILKAGDTIITKGNLNLAHDALVDFKFIGK